MIRDFNELKTNNEIDKMETLHEKYELHIIQKFIKTKSHFYYEKNNFYWDKLKHLIKKGKKIIIYSFFDKNITNMKLLWKQINNIINKIKNREKISCIKVNNVYGTNPDEISNKFNYFSTIAQNLNSKVKSNGSYNFSR